jgi:hypothetical protein
MHQNIHHRQASDYKQTSDGIIFLVDQQKTCCGCGSTREKYVEKGMVKNEASLSST